MIYDDLYQVNINLNHDYQFLIYTGSSEQIMPLPLFNANTVNPKRLYEIIKGVSLKQKDLGHIYITHDGISLKSGAIGQFQAVSFIPCEFFHSYNFNGTEPLEIVIALKDLYGVLGITQDDDAQDEDNDVGEFILPENSFYESDLDQEDLQQQIITEENDRIRDDDNESISNDDFKFNYQQFEASFKYEKEGATFDVELFDDTSSNIVEIVPLLQDPLHDIPEPPNMIFFFKILCYELRMILKDCLKTGSKVQLNGYKNEITILRFSSRNEYRFVEHNIKSEAFYQYRIIEDFQFTYVKGWTFNRIM
ncbi:hypothetical protein C1645_173239 [Glomus cerebriforme]|uniref:Uncharacterized protein n=1 Tax=Glomus cerebriforme TaxID=658196 RepID=A0A397TSM6_9GLOM|nr:hypothetical protein C1645_173239 [Glomus cerebriforme]